jgi:hypothetical protein
MQLLVALLRATISADPSTQTTERAEHGAAEGKPAALTARSAEIPSQGAAPPVWPLHGFDPLTATRTARHRL